MRILLILSLVILGLVNAWEVKEVIDSEGTQTYIIQCDSGTIKVIYFNSEKEKYEVTSTIGFERLEDGVKYICN